ncbi:MAG: hypothetical protein ORN98_10430 [Alphaproteobacteria bacterium]|nr:hypothetical protein [Alphaproteobacteria bacterium]
MSSYLRQFVGTPTPAKAGGLSHKRHLVSLWAPPRPPKRAGYPTNVIPRRNLPNCVAIGCKFQIGESSSPTSVVRRELGE